MNFIGVAHSAFNPKYSFYNNFGSFELPDTSYEFSYNGQKYVTDLKMGTSQVFLFKEVQDQVFTNRFNWLGKRGFIFIDTDNLPTTGRKDIMRFSINSNQYVNGVQNTIVINYNAEKKQITLFMNNEEMGELHVLYENIDRNTPDFIFFLNFGSFKKYISDKPYLSHYVIIFRETEPGSGILARGENKLIYTAHHETKTTYYDFHLSYGQGIQHLSYFFSQYSDYFTPERVCDRGFNARNSKQCNQEISDQINFSYLHTWRNVWGMQINGDNVEIVEDDDIPSVEIFQIPKFNMQKPVAPTCTFDLIGGIPCLADWLGYGFANIVWVITAVIDAIIDFFNVIIRFIGNFFKSIFDVFKKFALWIWQGIKGFFQPIFEPIYNFLTGLFTWAMKNFEDLQKISFTGTMDTCKEYNETTTSTGTTIAGNLTNIISLAIPFAPADNAEICTLNGRKNVDYQDNTKFLDTILILISFMSVIFTFISGHTKYD